MIDSVSRLEAAVAKDISEDRVWKQVVQIVTTQPDRVSGAGGDVVAARHLQAQMEQSGVAVEMMEMELLNSLSGSADLRVLSPETRAIEADCCLHIASTLDEGLSAELVDVGPGGETNYSGRDVRGKIVLAEVSYAPPSPEKARIAAMRGAIGIILMNWGTSETAHLPKRALKAVWGNPTPATFREIPQLAGVTVTRAAGEYLRDLCARGPVRVQLRAQSPRVWQQLIQPIGRIQGSTDQVIILSGHFDCWPPGATDNATGNAVMLELARVLARHQAGLRRSLIFAFWNGHEVAEAAGSTWFVDHTWDAIYQYAVAYLNIDSLGMAGASQCVVHSSPELAVFHAEVERQILGKPGERRPLPRTGDQSFFGIGVPSIAARFSHSPEQIAAWNGATLGWWNHTDQDTLDKVDRGLLRRELSLWAGYVVRLATLSVLPQRFTPLAADLQTTIDTLVEQDADVLALGDVAKVCGEFGQQARLLDAAADRLTERYARGEAPSRFDEAADALNDCLLRLSRLLTAPTRSVSGRYGQDSYGLSDLSTPLPALRPLATLRTLPPQSETARLLRTELRRRRNALAESLLEAEATITRALRAAEA